MEVLLPLVFARPVMCTTVMGNELHNSLAAVLCVCVLTATPAMIALLQVREELRSPQEIQNPAQILEDQVQVIVSTENFWILTPVSNV